MSFIEPAEAKKMISLYKTVRPTIPNGGIPEENLTLSETFIKEEVMDLLQQTDCKGLRAYFSMDENRVIRLVFVGTDAKGADLLPAGALIVERGELCPPKCPPPSTINS